MITAISTFFATIGPHLTTIAAVIVNVLKTICFITSYIFTGLGLSSIAKKFNLERSWFAWVPVLNDLLLGQIADKLVEQESEKKLGFSKALFILSCIAHSGSAIFFSLLIVHLVLLVIPILGWLVLALLVAIELLLLIVFIVPFVFAIIIMNAAALALVYLQIFSAYYIFKAAFPNQALLFTILSIIFASTPLKSIFVFCCRNKMPVAEEAEDMGSDEIEELA